MPITNKKIFGNRERLRNIVEETNTPAGRYFDILIIILILLSIITFSIDTIPTLDNETKFYLHISELIISLIFLSEYLLRIFVSKKPLAYIFSFLGVIDLLAILPFLLSSGLDGRALRIFRFFRIIRIFKIAKYFDASNHIIDALKTAREELVLFFIATFMMIYLSAIGIYFFENQAQPDIFSSIFAALWWAVATLTTVGYGDIYPVTTGGKIFTFLVLMCGLSLVTAPAGIIASALTKTVKK